MNIWEGEKKRERETNHKRLLTIKKKLRIDEWEGGWANQVMGIKESTCVEHWELYVSDESLNCTLETNITLYMLNN